MEYNETNKRLLSRQFGYIYQDYKLIENISAYNNLKIAMELSGKSENSAEINEALKVVGLEEYSKQNVMNMSGGQRQRVAIARAMIRDPKVLFADEPTGNLDSENTNNIFMLLKQLSEKMLVILVTHDTETVEKYADRIIRLKDGKVLEDSQDGEQFEDNKSQDKVPGTSIGNAMIKSRMSSGSVGVLAKSLNNAKKGRRIAFSIIIILLISILLFLSTWSLLTYNKSVLGTLVYKANAKGLMINLDVNSRIESRDDGETFTGTYRHSADMAKLSNYIETDLGGKTANIISANAVKIRYEYKNSTYSIDINGKPISLAHSVSKGNLSNIILSDNPQDIGIDIIRGRAPSGKNEVAISDGMFDYVDAMGGIRNPDINAGEENLFIPLSSEKLIGYVVNGVKIVGVFDDKLELDQKYYTYSAKNESGNNLIDLGDNLEDVKFELMGLVSDNILSGSIIASTAMQEYYNDICNISKGEKHIQVELTSGADSRTVSIMPANPDTVYWSKTESLSQDEVLIPHVIADGLGINDGDIVKLSADWMLNLQDGESHVIEKIAEKSFRARISEDTGFVIVNDAEYNVFSDNYELNSGKIYFYKQHISLNDLNSITAFVDKNYKSASNDTMMKASANLRYMSDYGEDVYDTYETMRLIKTLIYIFIAIVIAAYLLLSFSTTNVVISSKANELLILKSLGATKYQFVGIYGIIAAAQTVFELIVGSSIGILLLFALNTVIGAALNISVVLLPLDFIALGIMAGVIVLVNALSLVINIAKMNTKNLRKAFQSTHK